MATSLDWDGDGRKDLLNRQGIVHLSGTNAFSGSETTSLPVGVGACAYAFDLDANGDGLDELACVEGLAPTTVRYFARNGSGVRPDLAVCFSDNACPSNGVNDGVGVKQIVSYVPSSWEGHTKQISAGYPYRDDQPKLLLVRSVTHTNGIGGTYAMSYWYYGAARNLAGRGFAGFAQRTSHDSRTGLQTDEYFRRDFPYTGMVWQTDVHQPGGVLVSRVINTPDLITLNGSWTEWRVHPYIANTSSSQYEVGGALNGVLITQTYDSYTYDAYGNLTSHASSITDRDPNSPQANQTWTRTTSIAPYVDASANWCLSVPDWMSVTLSASNGESSVVQVKDFAPNMSACRIDGETIEPSSPNRRVDQSYGFDPFGNVNAITVVGRNPDGSAMAGRSTYLGWGSTGQFAETLVDALGFTTSRNYDSTYGTLAAETDPNGIARSWQTDAFGRLTRENRPDGTARRFTIYDCASIGCMDGNNRIVVKTEELATSGAVIKDSLSYYDAFDRLQGQADMLPGGGYSWVHTDYDQLGRVLRQNTPCNRASCSVYWVTNGYDLLGRLVWQQRPISESNGTLQTTYFEHQGRRRSTTDPQGKITTHITDVVGSLRRSQDANGYAQVFGYDAAGSLKVVYDTLSNQLFTANYSYGIRAFQDSLTDMDLGTRTFSYNSLGELVGGTDAKSQSFTQTYDALSRPLVRTEAEGQTTWNWGTSAAARNIGALASVSAPGISEGYAYDGAGRMVTRQIISDATYNFDYSYEPGTGLLESITYPTSTSSYRLKLRYGYQNGTLSQVSDYNGSTVFWQATAFSTRGQVMGEALGNGVVTSRGYDAVTGRLSFIRSGPGGGASLQNESYLYDLVGNLTQRQNANLGLIENFYYDNVYRLDYSQLTNGSGTATNLDVSYDLMGNITARSDIANGASWSYHPSKKHAVTQAGSAAYTYGYDANGNVSTRHGYSITWTSYDYPSLINGAGKSLSFFYDANRQRYKQIYVSDGGAVETTMYIGGLLEKVTVNGVTDWRHYVKVGSGVVAIVSRKSNGTNATRYMLEDNLGSPSGILNADGSMHVGESFSAFGARRDPLTWTDACPCDDLAKIKDVSRRGFTGHEAIGGVSMGLNHMNGRVQDAITGRFLSADPHVPNPMLTQSYNRYSYVRNNPLGFVDPAGFSEELAEVTVTGTRLAGAGASTCGMFGGGYMANICDPAEAATFHLSGGGVPSTVSAGSAATADVGTGATGESEVLDEVIVSANKVVQAIKEVAAKASPYLPFRSLGACLDSAAAGEGGCGVTQWAQATTEGALEGVLFAVSGGTGLAARGVTNAVPSTLARVIPGKGSFPTLGQPGRADVFVTAADDIAGLKPAQLSQRLGIPASDTFTIIRFPTPSSGLASPVNRLDTGFMGGGLTSGGAREFVCRTGQFPRTHLLRSSDHEEASTG